tara:strand:- start:333 stop:3833 length:3501 start_codon:yes stop_codon:yes gene_type:complete
MKLKTIKLAGFKSFVDSTTVAFPGNMCAVVGPNGCGKSNVIDAVRWVMGESSAKNLRTESMADVIFNGTEDRAPVGTASIELVFDNADGSVGGEYASYSEISIRRQVARDGQSDYFLNGGRCRRRDITDIFLGTGLGPRSYAIIEQGTISRLIESRPEDLRVFIEEAAGISKYRERRKETESRMKRTTDNLDRLKDIREELDRQLQHLKRQARAAEKYGLLKEEERRLDAQVKALQWKKLQSELDDAMRLQSELDIKFEAAVADLQKIDTDIESSRVEVADGTEVLNSVQSEYYAVGAKVSRVEQELRHIEERSQQLSADFEQTKSSLDQTEGHLVSDKSRLKEIADNLVEISPNLTELQDHENSAALSYAEADQAMQSWQMRWEEFRERSADANKRAEVERSRIQQLEEALLRLQEKSGRLKDEKTELNSLDDPGSLEIFEERKRSINEELALARAEQNKCTEILQTSKKDEQVQRKSLDESREKLQRLEGRRASLETLQEAIGMNFSQELETWFEDNKIDSKDLVLNHLNVTDGWQEAVELVLGECLGAVCVDSIAEFEDGIIDFMSHSFRLVEKSSHQTASSNNQLSRYVHGGVALESLLAGVIAAENIEEAFALRNRLGPGESVITREGLWLGSDWLRVGPSDSASQGSINRQLELESISSEINQTKSVCTRSEIQVEQLQEAIVHAEKMRDEIQLKIQNLSSEEAAIAAELSAKSARQDEISKRLERIELEMIRLASQSTEDKQALSESNRLLQEAIENVNRLEEDGSSIKGERDALKIALDAASENVSGARSAVQEVEMKRQALDSEQEARSESISRVESQIIDLNNRLVQLEDAINVTQLPTEQLKVDLETHLENRLQSEARLSEARQQVADSEHKLREKEGLRIRSDQGVQECRSVLEERKINNQGLIVQRDTIQQQLSDLELSPLDLLADLPEDANEADTSEQLLKAAQRIVRLGPINLAAIDEYDQQAERKKYLDSQNDDLEEALATLESAIRKIDKETRSRFKETFEKVNDGLQGLFPKVFGGGSAHLEMTGGDLLNTGISIMARPPGKKNTTINQLSGGEKALTAIALVFSIFKLNPAPFCMLDEVDAPLDDANVERYARMVREMSDSVQFIFVTHNKITMEMADHLMGVTMNEPGVSRLVSVDVQEAVEMAAS